MIGNGSIVVKFRWTFSRYNDKNNNLELLWIGNIDLWWSRRRSQFVTKIIIPNRRIIGIRKLFLLPNKKIKVSHHCVCILLFIVVEAGYDTSADIRRLTESHYDHIMDRNTFNSEWSAFSNISQLHIKW